MKRIIISFAVAAMLGTSAYATCTVNYSCGDGASGTVPASQSITEATKVFTPSAPGTCAKSGYVFSHWQVSSMYIYLNGGGSGTMYDAAWAGTEYTIPFTTASDTCSNRSATITLTAQWVDASYVGIPTSKSYVDTGLNAKQPKFENLGNDKLMLYSNTTNGATLSRDIVTELGDSTSATSVPTIGAINTKLATKQKTLNGTAGWVMENTGTSGELKQRPVYSTTDNYKTALVEAEDLNQMIIDAVNSELTQVADGWRINDSVTLPTLRLYPDASIGGTGNCYRSLNGSNDRTNGTCSAATQSALGASGSKSGKWGAVFPYGDIVGKSVCSATQGTENIAATTAQNSSLTTEFNAQTGNGNLNSDQKNCWCKMESVGGEPMASSWVFRNTRGDSASCAYDCARNCALNVLGSAGFRVAVFGAVQ